MLIIILTIILLIILLLSNEMRQSQSLITKILMTDDYNDLRVQQEEREKAGGELQKI